MTIEPEASPSPASSPELSPFQRAVLVFTRPGGAWTGLERKAQWFWPLLLSTVLSAGLTGLLYPRVFIPMMQDQWDEQVASGAMTTEQVDKVSGFFVDSPVAPWVFAGQQAVVLPLITLLIALIVWFGCGFVLGTRMRYRHALEVVAWAGLVNVPATLLTFGIAAARETLKGVHLGLAALLPEADSPSRFMTGLGILLDALGPFSIWWLAVMIIGASVLSGAPRRNVGWVLGALYLAIAVFAAVVGAMLQRAA